MARNATFTTTRARKDGATPLSFAVEQSHKDVVVWLIDNGAQSDVNTSNHIGVTPLVLAIERHDLPIIMHLLKHGARETINSYYWTPETCNGLYHQRTALLMAVAREFDVVVELLVKNGVDVNKPIGHCVYLNTADYEKEKNAGNLHPLSSTQGMPSDAHLNLKQLDPLENDYYYVPLSAAACRGNFSICEMLIGAGADVSAKNRVGNNILHNVCKIPRAGLDCIGKKNTADIPMRLKIMDLLFAHQPDAIEKDVCTPNPHFNWTPMLSSVKAGNIEMLRWLYEHGGEETINERSVAQLKPNLDSIAKISPEKFGYNMKSLDKLEVGSDEYNDCLRKVRRAQNEEALSNPESCLVPGYSPMTLAIQFGNKRIIKLLRKWGVPYPKNVAELSVADEKTISSNGLDIRKIDAAKRSVTAKSGCAMCGKANEMNKKSGKIIKLKLCSRCHTVAYCSRQCQQKHWSEGHKKKCAAAKKKRVTIPTGEKTPSEFMMSGLKGIEMHYRISQSNSQGIGGGNMGFVPGIMALAEARGMSFTNFMISEMNERGYDLGDIRSLKLTIDSIGPNAPVRVRLVNLKSKKYNGRTGTRRKYLDDKKRFEVKLDGDGKLINVKPGNLEAE